MILYGGFNEVGYDLTLRSLGLTKEEFLSLPKEFQEAIIFNHWSVSRNKRISDNKVKKEIVKKKVLTFLNKK